ncbi:MAG TPA: MgtC/SapB family protein [Chitinophagaceae bacterium]|nr:MgtC/SapB family protein [Chitinophagaceae bacterium]
MNDELLKLLLSLLAGALLGIEREYKYKYAGIRTIALISVGSTLFTIMSLHMGGSASTDRIASNILTGIGFIGAGVIFKNDLSLNGLTTAATIWVASSMGMAIGYGDFVLGFTTLGIALFALLGLKYIQNALNGLHQIRVYKLSFQADQLSSDQLESVFKEYKITYKKLKEYRNAGYASCVYELSGHSTNLDRLNDHMMENKQLDSFNY